MPFIGIDNAISAIDQLVEDTNDNVRGVYIGGLTPIISETPADKGEARNGWILSVGTPSTSISTTKSTSGSSSFRQLAQMPNYVLDKVIYFTNNTAHIGVLEYGGFPNPVKQGSYVDGSYQILSIGGFSKAFAE